MKVLNIKKNILKGHIGIYTRGGALLNGFTDPGVHMMVPIITRFN